MERSRRGNNTGNVSRCKPKKKGWLDVEHIDTFPCEDLRTIDQLWVKHSNGRFGFSVQKRIYQGFGGTSKYDKDIWEKFGDKVGWRKGGDWLYYTDITFDKKAPEGHLPQYIFHKWGWVLVWGWCEGRCLLSRRDL
jgi:hypothetical protein